LGGLLIVATQISERMGRLSAFLHPQLNKDDDGLQQMQRDRCGDAGGLGNGMLYLPYAHTDLFFHHRDELVCGSVSGGFLSFDIVWAFMMRARS